MLVTNSNKKALRISGGQLGAFCGNLLAQLGRLGVREDAVDVALFVLCWEIAGSVFTVEDCSPAAAVLNSGPMIEESNPKSLLKPRKNKYGSKFWSD